MVKEDLYLIFGGAMVALLAFIYINRYLQNKRDERREHWREKKEEQLQQLLDLKKKNADETNENE